ncbi:hypothetical protein ACFS7Z_16105 [Pontibacter toksunensis]|uniref:Uncharacterized protein n=1 Tax=Pontibacter toksunensis TaxID=1332631 RepID=A0ABW6BY87_9BACT
MKFKNPDKLLKLKFLGKHRDAIIREYLKYKPKKGYVFIKADSHFNAPEEPRFIERGFDEDMFQSIQEAEGAQDTRAAQQNECIYYEIFWESDKSSYYLKERL